MIDNYFNPHVFALSNDFLVKKLSSTLGDIFLIENFYDNINLVHEEIKKLPMTLIWDKDKRKEINNKVLDCRKSYSSNMSGTELPFIKQLPSKIYRHLNLKEEQVYVPESLLVNCSKKLEEYSENYYYNIHKDGLICYDSIHQYAVIVFLNLDYTDKTTGFNIYRNSEKLSSNKMFIRRDEIDLVHFIQAKPNMAVVIPKDVFHGAELGSNSQFCEDWRYTQVIFLPIFESCNKVNLTYN